MSTVDAMTLGFGPRPGGLAPPDEADVSVGNASKLPQPKGDGRVTFLTLTDHFSKRASPPPNGKEIYPAFFDSADVIGFDTYPVEVRCTLAQIDNVYWMQRELVSLTGGKPTFQWIEAGPMEHCRHNQDPTPASCALRPGSRSRAAPAVSATSPTGGRRHPQRGAPCEPRHPRARPRAALAGRESELVGGEPVRVGARRYNGATYVIAVNTSTLRRRVVLGARPRRPVAPRLP